MSSITIKPLWKYRASTDRYNAYLDKQPGAKAGKYVRIVNLSGDPYQSDRPFSPKEEDKGRRFTSMLQETVARTRPLNGIEWEDDGDDVYEEQNFLKPALAFARWQDYTDLLPKFQLDVDFDTHPVWKLSHDTPRPARFPVMIAHGCGSGLLMPCEFDGAVVVGHKKVAWLTFETRAASVLRVHDECRELAEIVGLGDPFVFDPKDPWQRVTYAINQLRTVCRLSLEHRLPVIFNF